MAALVTSSPVYYFYIRRYRKRLTAACGGVEQIAEQPEVVMTSSRQTMFISGSTGYGSLLPGRWRARRTGCRRTAHRRATGSRQRGPTSPTSGCDFRHRLKTRGHRNVIIHRLLLLPSECGKYTDFTVGNWGRNDGVTIHRHSRKQWRYREEHLQTVSISIAVN